MNPSLPQGMMGQGLHQPSMQSGLMAQLSGMGQAGLIPGMPSMPQHLHQQQHQQQQGVPQAVPQSMAFAPQPSPRPPMGLPLPEIKPVPGPPRTHTGPYKSREFTFASHHDGNGIVFFMGLNRKEGKWYNPVDTRKLRVIASSLDSGTLPMTVDQEFNELLFASKDEYPSWVVFDFLECSVRPTYYSLAHKGTLQAFMRSWKFEGSNDGAVWDTLCIHTNDASLSKPNTVASWAVKTNMAFRYLRILLEQGGNAEGTSALMFNAFEVYGEFRIPTTA